MSESGAKPNISGVQALNKLMEGNERFMKGKARFSTVCKDKLADLARGQQPFATIVGCSDSRVPPELIFDADFGELFIIRVAGNVVSPEVKGSLQYAGGHLHTPLFMVLGHEGCGAVKAALQYHRDRHQHGAHVQLIVENICAGLPEPANGVSDDELLTAAVEANVRWSMQQIMKTPEWENAVKAEARLVGAVYEITAGRVRIL